MFYLRRRRRQRLSQRKERQSRLRRGLSSTVFILTALLGLLLIGLALGIAWITSGLPDPGLLADLFDPQKGSLLQPSRILDRSGSRVLRVLTPAGLDAPRTFLSLDPKTPEPLPANLVNATLALEDPNFYQGPGWTLAGIFDPESHTTLAQKLAANLLLWQEPASLRRALRERVLAAAITSRFGREKILEWTLNSENYGQFAIGAAQAARFYFNKPVSKLNLAEAALLATIGHSPDSNLQDSVQASNQQKNLTLQYLKFYRLADPADIDQALKTTLTLSQKTPTSPGFQSLLSLVFSQLKNPLVQSRVELGGMQVVTSIDGELQQRTDCLLATQYARMNGSPNAPACPAAEMLAPLPPVPQPASSMGVVVLNPQTGQLLALSEISDRAGEYVNLAPHRPGTLLIPFVYLAGFTRGLSPSSLVWDVPTTAAVVPADASLYQGPLSLRSALASDNLRVASQLYLQMGSGLVRQTLAAFGLDNDAPDLNTFLDGGLGYSNLQFARAYGILANQGILAQEQDLDPFSPGLILELRQDLVPTAAVKNEIVSKQVVSAQLAYLINDMLASQASELGRPAAIKTDTSEQDGAVWSVGYTPGRVVSVWMDGAGAGKRPVAGLWNAVMQAASAGVAPDGWKMPAGLIQLKVCSPSGLLPTDACPATKNEVFIEGSQPLQPDSLFKSYEINRETGLLATVFTPKNLVIKKTYMEVPPEAQSWAKSRQPALPQPPTAYDNIQIPATDPDAVISSPVMFASLHGLVQINGTAGGDQFSYYRLQYGQGLNPLSWTQIGSDISEPVSASQLAEWDTSSLDGLYCLQLLVIQKDRSLKTATVQVTITNP